VPEVPFALALAAGMLAAVNPCGFALLPAYLTLLIVDPADSGGVSAVGRALRMTLAMTAGFVAVFGLFAVVAVPLALSLERFLPWATVAIGIVLVVLGLRLLAGADLVLTLPRLAGRAPDGSVRSMAGYGVVYAVASLSCTIGPFLAVVTSTTRAGSVAGGFLVMVAYGVGMGLVVGSVAIAVALARDGMVARMRRAVPLIGRISGALLVVAGAYVAYYGWWELRVLAGGGTSDPVIDTAGRIQGTLASWVASAGPWWVLGGLTVLLGLAWWRRRRSGSPAPTVDRRV
jgi:cytochrome c biogenesis protein CcdA